MNHIAQGPSFTIYQFGKEKKIVPTLKHCFIGRVVINTNNPPATILADDGWVYQCVYDSRLPIDTEVEVIISFQSHTYGRFAVIRATK